jgi:hypothetical protein
MSREILTFFYKGYEIRKNLLTRRWVGLPLCSGTTEGKLTALNLDQLRTMIDAVPLDTKPDPWELPSKSAA